MRAEQTPEKLESIRREYERRQEPEQKPYTPRPKWQIVMAWVLFGVVVLGILNLCYWQFTA